MHAARNNKHLSRQAIRALATSAEAKQPTPNLDAKAQLRALRTEREKGVRKISGSQSAKATEAATRPTPAPTFQQGIIPARAPGQSRHGQHGKHEAMDESFIGMSGGAIFHEMMLRHNVKHVFGYPGGAILPVFDAIYNSKHFDFVLPRHEQGAGHMAEGYARASGLPGVVLVTSGPGATNVVTPMQDALSDGTPLVVFCGQVATSAIGSDAFQEADVVGISRSCTKWNVMVKDIAELPRRINEAFKIATSGRPGPVLVDLPKDVTAGILKQAIPLRYTRPERAQENLPTNPLSNLGRHLSNIVGGASAQEEAASATVPAPSLPPPDPMLIARAAELIANAETPIIYAGQGMLSHPDGPKLLAQLAEEGNIPVTTTLLGMGSFNEHDDRSLHMLGMHGSAYANLAMQKADVIIALGARFDDRVTGKVDTFAPVAKAAANAGRGGIIHFEIQPKNINKVVEATVAVEGDVVHNLRSLLPAIHAAQGGKSKAPKRKQWFDKIRHWKKQYPFTFEPSKSDALMKPQEVVEALDKWAHDRKGDVIISTGVGQHQMWAAQHYRWTHPRTMITSGGLGTMGYGLPSAIGAKVARPDKIVVDIDGDASFSMTAMELATAAQYGIGVKVLILNNEFQGMVLQWQDLFYEKRYSHTEMQNPNFVKLAEAMNVKAIRCDNSADLPAKMKEFMEYDNSKPIVLEARVVKNEHVYPMVQAGKALHEQILHPQLMALKASDEKGAWS